MRFGGRSFFPRAAGSLLLAALLLLLSACGPACTSERPDGAQTPEQEPADAAGADGAVRIHGSICRPEGELREAQVQAAAARIEQVIGRNCPDNAVYLAVVPDKNYYLTADSAYPRLDYDRLLALLRADAPTPQSIDLFDLLSADAYYRTDLHWRQEALLPVAERLLRTMCPEASPLTAEQVTQVRRGPFYGTDYAQANLACEADTLTFLHSPAIDAAVLTGPELDGEHPVYVPERKDVPASYDAYAAGSQAVLYLHSPLAQTQRSLVVFRDSFGSSLAPLLLEAYAQVTLVDLRFLSNSLLPQYVDFSGADVLFLYSVPLLNAGMLLK